MSDGLLVNGGVPPLWQMLTFHFLTQQLYLTQPRAPGDLTHAQTQRYTDIQHWLCVGLQKLHLNTNSCKKEHQQLWKQAA